MAKNVSFDIFPYTYSELTRFWHFWHFWHFPVKQSQWWQHPVGGKPGPRWCFFVRSPWFIRHFWPVKLIILGNLAIFWPFWLNFPEKAENKGDFSRFYAQNRLKYTILADYSLQFWHFTRFPTKTRSGMAEPPRDGKVLKTVIFSIFGKNPKSDDFPGFSSKLHFVLFAESPRS